jgi:predicted phage terminase large subunit-like protein
LYSTFTEGVDDDVRRYMLDNRQAPKLDRAKREEVRLEAEAKKEFARRELCRQLMMPFVLRFFTAYKPGWVHQDICRRLEKFVRDVEEQRSPRLIMTLPPRHGKSTLLSDMFPSWVLGKHPEWEFIATSYAVTLPIKFSRAIRDRLRDPAYAGVFPECSLRADAQGIEEWRLTAGGGYRAAGVGGGITGLGAHCLIVDDPIKDWAEAQSETIREGAKSWFNTAAYNRLAPGGGVIIVQTRWHDDDLAGYVLSQMQEQIEAGLAPEDIDNWELVNYPAIATGDEYLMPDSSIEVDPLDTPSGARLLRRKGEALHPERYDLAKLMRIKNRYTPQEWAALYQQDPVPDDGAFFGKDMFRHYAYLPGTRDEYTYVTAWDVAIGEDRRNDWTVGVVCAINERGDMYVIDMVRGRYGTQELVQLAVGMIERYDCQVFGMEHGQIKMTLWPLIVDEMRRRRLTCNIADLKPIKDKETRATPLRGMMQRGVVMFPMQNQRPWVERMVGEMLRFPAGKHDDIVDALAWAAFMYRTAPRPLTSTTLKKQHVKSFREELDQFPGALGTSDSETSYMSY